LTFGLGIIILQGVSRRKSLAGVNIMLLVERLIESMNFKFLFTFFSIAVFPAEHDVITVRQMSHRDEENITLHYGRNECLIKSTKPSFIEMSQ
jgi:hypothetical protein